MYLAAVQVDALSLGSGTRNRASRCTTPEAAYEFIARSVEGLTRGDDKPVVEVFGVSYEDVGAALLALKSSGISPCRETKS
jgi:hypothetical protein